MPRHPLHTRGFTLVEVTVSVLVLGAIIVASSMLLQATKVNQTTRDQDLALRIANNEIEVLRAGGYAALPATGPFADPSLSALKSGTETITVTVYNAKTKKVDVTVSWSGQDSTTRTVTLTTLITETGSLL